MGHLTADELSSDAESSETTEEEEIELFERFLVVPPGAGKLHKPTD